MIKYPAILLFMTIVFFGCSNSSFDKIKGKWSASGDTGDSTELHTWYLEYEFDGRNHRKSGYPPLTEEGDLGITEERGDSIKFYFNVQKSDPKQKSYEEWLILKDSTLRIGELNFTDQL